MPVKLRCRGCEKVLNAPDNARGRVIQCPKCGTKLKVPAGDGAPAKATKAAAPKGGDSAELLARIDLTQAEDAEERICPYCAAELGEEEAVCRNCGMNVTTGRMDAKEAKKRSRVGLDPALFYQKAWSESWAFLKEHWRLATRTGGYFTLFTVLNGICWFMVAYCEGIPPKFFWFCMALLTSLGLAGWAWFLTFNIIESTMTRDEKMLERVQFDMFQTVSLGLRAVLWPGVMMLPFIPVLMVVAVMMGVTAAIGGGLGAAAGAVGFFAVFGACLLFPVFVFPLATVHMTQKYTYKAWILWEMLKIAVRNIPPTLYYWVIAIAVSLPLAMVFVPMVFVLGLDSGLNPFLSNNVNGVTARITEWALKLAGETPNPQGWLFMLIKAVLNIFAAVIVLAPMCYAAAFPAVFMMKVNGLLGHYNRERLGLINHMNPNTPATFWVRLLAFTIDQLLIPLTSVLVFKEKLAIMVAWLINAIGFVLYMFIDKSDEKVIFKGFMATVWPLYNSWMYFCIQEATSIKTTVGKDAFGLIVVTDDNKQLTIKHATGRFFAGLLSYLPAGFGFVMCAFHPQKKALHDVIAKTKVVWKGER